MTVRNSCAHLSAAGFFCIAAIIALCGLGSAQEKGKLSGTLFDPQGAAVANAPVELRWNNRPDAGGVIIDPTLQRRNGVLA